MTDMELTAIEISEALQLDKRWVLKKAENEQWPCFLKPNQRGGGYQKIFKIKELPSEIRNKIIAGKLNCDPRFIPQKNFDENKAKAFLGKWNTATEDNQRRAYVRQQILEALETFCESNRYKQTAGENFFTVLYNNKTAPGIDENIYSLEKSLSIVKLRRWRASYRKTGLAGLLMNYKTNFGKSRAITPEMQVFIVSHIGQKPHIKPSTLHKLISKTFDPYPSRKTVERFVKKWKEEHPQEYALLENPARWKNSFMPAFGDAAAGVDHVGHTLEMDSTPADAKTKDGKRCCIIGCTDVFSRCAVVIVSPTSKSTAIAACIRKAILKWGVPKRIRKDNGKDYQSIHIDAITVGLEIETPPLPKYSPESKPFVERFFGTMTRGLEELLPGYVGHSVADRQAIRARDTWGPKIMTPGPPVDIPLTMQELTESFDKGIEIYENTPHRGLNGKTPKEKFLESPYFPPKIRDERVLDILLAPVSRPRIIQKKGISIDGVTYHANELIPHIGKRIIARRDLENAGLIYVFHASKNEYICTATNEPLQGEHLGNYMEAKNRHAKELKQRVKAIKSLGNGNRNALSILIEDKIEHQPEKIIPFQVEAETPAILEARKAVRDADGLPPVSEAPVINKKIAQINRRQIPDPADTSWKTTEDLDREYEEAIRQASAQKKIRCM